MADLDGWRVLTAPDFFMMGDRVLIGRQVGDHTETIVGFGPDGATEVQSHALYTANDFRGLLLPHGVLDAIVEHVRPGPSKAELAAVREALKVERGRVDQVLGRVIPQAGP